jgi:Putative translation initiation inhibitor, yjgF family
MVKRINPGSRMSQVVMHSGFIYVSGQVADLPNPGIDDQTKSVLSKIDRLLAEAGATKSDLVNVTVLLPHITDFDKMNAVYDAWIDPANPPSRACYEARLADPELRIEITAVAAVPGT